MAYQTIITCEELNRHLDDERWLLFDTRFNLMDEAWGRRAYQSGHIPGAYYIHLNDDLSGDIVPGKTGRHPLPSVSDFVERIACWGITPDTQVVIYDQREGMFAARMWWMLHLYGFENVAVLSGGFANWLAAGYEQTQSLPEPRQLAEMSDTISKSMYVNHDDVLRNLQSEEYLLIDARAADRYRGENETIDAKAGHIPGALSLPFMGNLDAAGSFLPQDILRARYEDVVKGRNADEVVFYCGSGVTAAHNILAMSHAGLGLAKLYSGSWSEWIVDPGRPIAEGA